MKPAPENPGSRIAFVSNGLPLGGSTSMLCNLGGELARRAVPVLILGLEKKHPMEHDFRALGVPTITFDDRRFIFEDRLLSCLNALREFQPTAVVSCLGASSY